MPSKLTYTSLIAILVFMSCPIMYFIVSATFYRLTEPSFETDALKGVLGNPEADLLVESITIADAFDGTVLMACDDPDSVAQFQQMLHDAEPLFDMAHVGTQCRIRLETNRGEVAWNDKIGPAGIRVTFMKRLSRDIYEPNYYLIRFKQPMADCIQQFHDDQSPRWSVSADEAY